jgi:hypothetical protein
MLNLESLCRCLGGEISGGQLRCPGPGHSAVDRSLSVKVDAGAPDGFIVHSFAGDDPIACRDYVREKAGARAFKPNGKRQHASSDEIEKFFIAAVQSQRQDKPKTIVETYDYEDEAGNLLYQVVRYEPKDFRQRRPDGNGGWTWKLDDVRRVIYRLPDFLKWPDATAFICEGEKDADRVASLDHCATTVAHGEWANSCVAALAGRDCLILEDADEPGAKKALAAATALHGTAKTIRIIRLPDLTVIHTTRT